MKKIILIPLLLLGLWSSAYCEETKEEVEVLYKYRFGVDFQIKLIDNLKLNIEPEFRFNDGFERLVLNGGLSYKTFGCLYWGATYRMSVDREEGASTSASMFSAGENTHHAEVYHRYAFDLTYKDKFGRFTPSFRVRYNNFADDEIDDKEYMRYRAKIEYNIRKCILTPHVAVEGYQALDEKLLYKMRYGTGFSLKTSKSTSLSFDYKFDFFTLEYKNANIFSVGYKCKF